MSWGCKPENKPDGCKWANRVTYPRLGMTEWWCDLCERGDVINAPAFPAQPNAETEEKSDE